MKKLMLVKAGRSPFPGSSTGMKSRQDEGTRGISRIRAWMWDLPGIEQCPVQERPVVVIPNEIGHLDGPRAAWGLEVSVNLNLIFRIPNIHQKNVKMQH